MELETLKAAHMNNAKEILQMQRAIEKTYKTTRSVQDATINIGNYQVPLEIAEEHLHLKKDHLELSLARDIAAVVQNAKETASYEDVMVLAKKLKDGIFADTIHRYPELAVKGKVR